MAFAAVSIQVVQSIQSIHLYCQYVCLTTEPQEHCSDCISTPLWWAKSVIMRVALMLSHPVTASRYGTLWHVYFFSILRGEKFTYVTSTTRCILSSFSLSEGINP